MKACRTFPTIVGLLISGALLQGTAYAGVWEITVSTTNSKNPSTPTNVPLVRGESTQSRALAMVSAFGTTSSAQTGTAQAAYSGTWTFRWIPTSSTDWPSAYTIRQIKMRMYTAQLINATGTVTGLITGGATQATVTLPSSPTATSTFPTPSTTTDTSIPNLTIKTTTLNGFFSHSVSGGWRQMRQQMTVIERSYTAAWFTSNFSVPADVVLTFTVESQDVSASLNYSSSSSSGHGAASVLATETFTGQ